MSIYRGRALRWAGEKQSVDKSLAAVINIAENLNFSPYVYIPTGIHWVQLFEDMGSEVALVA